MPRAKRTAHPDSPTAIPELPPDEPKPPKKSKSVVKTVDLSSFSKPADKPPAPHSVLPPEDTLLCTVCWVPTPEREMQLFTNAEGVVGHRCASCQAKAEQPPAPVVVEAAPVEEPTPDVPIEAAEDVAEVPVELPIIGNAPSFPTTARDDDRWDDDTGEDPDDEDDEIDFAPTHGYDKPPEPPAPIVDTMESPPALSSDVETLQEQVRNLTRRNLELEQLKRLHKDRNDALREIAVQERNAADQGIEAVRRMTAALAELDTLLGTNVGLDGAPGTIAPWMTAMANDAIATLPEEMDDRNLAATMAELIAKAFAVRGAHNDAIVERLQALPNGAGRSVMLLEIAVRKLARTFEIVPTLPDTDLEVRKDLITQAWTDINEAAGLCRSAVLSTIDDLTRAEAAEALSRKAAVEAASGLPPRRLTLKKTKPTTEESL